MATVPVTLVASPAMFPVTCDPGKDNAGRVVSVLFATAVTFAAVPVVFWLSIGMSAAWISDRLALVPSDLR